MNIIIGGFSEGLTTLKTFLQFICSFYVKASCSYAEKMVILCYQSLLLT